MVDFLQLKNHLNNFASVYNLVGDDEWIKQRSLELIEGSLEIENRELNIITLEEPKHIDDIMNVVLCDTFMSKQKMVVVDGFIAGQKTDEIKKQISAFANSKEDYCAVVFTNSQLPSIAGVVEVNCNHLPTFEVVKWVMAYFKQNSKAIDRDTATKLVEYCLCDMTRVSTEAEKLNSFSKDTVTMQDIELQVVKDSEFLIYDLGKAIAKKDRVLALNMTKGLVANGEAVRSVFSVLYNYYRRLYYIRLSTDKEDVIADNLGVKPAAVKYQKDVAFRYKPMQLRRALSCFLEADKKLKQFYNDKETLDFLVLQLLEI